MVENIKQSINLTSKKATLVIDGHWFARSRFAVLQKDNQISFKENVQADRDLFMAKLTQDLAAELRACQHGIDDVVIVHDYKSWRKNHTMLKAPWETESSGESYKGTRVYSEDVNWLEMYKCLIDWGALLEQHFSVLNLRAYGAEGDDLMFAVSNIFNNAGRNVVLFSTDGDLIQLCTTKDNGAYTALYKKKMGTKAEGYKSLNVLLCDQALHDALTTETASSVFDNGIGSTSPHSWFKEFFASFNSHDINAYLLNKICTGDAGDNVSPLMQRKSGDRTYKITSNILEKSLAKLNMSYDSLTHSHLYDAEFISRLTQVLHQDFMKMLTLPDEYKQFYINKFIENRHLMHLSKDEIPLQVQDSMKTAMQEKAHIIKEPTRLSGLMSANDALATMGVHYQYKNNNQSNDFFNNFS